MHILGIGMQAKPGRALEGAVLTKQLAEIMTRVSGIETTPWSAIAGYPVGSSLLTTRFDDLGAMTAARASLMADPEYPAIQQTASDVLAAPSTLLLNKVIGVTAGYTPKAVLSVVNVTIAGGKFSAAMAWASDMLGYVESVAGAPGLLTLSTAGAYGQLGFVLAADSLTESQVVDDKLANDPGYLSRLDEAGGLFEPGAHRWLAQRID